MATETAPAALTESEKIFVEKVAQYYYENDGMPHERGRVVGYMMICDPAAQTADEISLMLGVERAAIDRIVDQLTPRTTR